MPRKSFVVLFVGVLETISAGFIIFGGGMAVVAHTNCAVCI